MNESMSRSGIVELEVVLSVARTLNFRATARELDMSPTAVGNAVSGLEHKLGVRLFNRSTRSVSLTEAGKNFVGRIGPAMGDIQLAMDEAHRHGDSPRGTLRIVSSVMAAQAILQPVVLRFLQLHPDMGIELLPDDGLVDIVGDGADAGIRDARAIPRDMIAVPLGAGLRMSIVASLDYLAEAPPLLHPQDLAKHRCVRARLADGSLHRWTLSRNGERFLAAVDGPLVLGEPSLMVSAALSGAGLAYVPDWLAQSYLATGRLVRVLADWTQESPPFALYYPSRRHVPAGLRAFIALLREHVQS